MISFVFLDTTLRMVSDYNDKENAEKAISENKITRNDWDIYQSSPFKKVTGRTNESFSGYSMNGLYPSQGLPLWVNIDVRALKDPNQIALLQSRQQQVRQQPSLAWRSTPPENRQ